MQKDTRALKLGCLAKCTDYVNLCDDKEDMDGNHQALWVLLWPMPKLNQIAVVNCIDGTIERFVLQSGTSTQEVDVDSWINLIDRRINYLWDRHRSEVDRIVNESKRAVLNNAITHVS